MNCFKTTSSIVIFVLLMFLVLPSAHASTTLFRNAGAVLTDGNPEYYNLTNCLATDGNTCDRAYSPSYASLYFTNFGTYNDFGIPDGSTITKARIRVTGKTSSTYYVGLSLEIPAITSCQFPSYLMTGYLGNETINTQEFTVNVNQSGLSSLSSYCLQPYFFKNNKIVFRINYSSSQAWSANIDNFEIAFDYDPPTSTSTPTLTPTPVASTFTPTPTLTPAPTPVSKVPLILIPGVGGSELKTTRPFVWNEDNGHGGTYFNNYTSDEKIWLNSARAILPGDDDYFDILRLNDDGKTSLVNLELTGTLFGGYDDMIKFFTDNGYELNRTLFLFPYDWRKDISLTTPLLAQVIDEIEFQTGNQKVDIIAHSMGGLVARNYIADPLRAQKVRKLFTLGVPHLGSVDTLKKLRFGGCLTKGFLNNIADSSGICLGISPSEVKDIVGNMTSGYELSPSKEYFSFYNGNDKNRPLPYLSNGIPLVNFDQIKSFLTNLNYNTSLFDFNESFHSLDNKLSDTNNVKVINIVGSGLSTLGQIREWKKNLLGSIKQTNDGYFINGDKTVPLFSASLKGDNKSLLGNADIYYTNQDHGGLIASGSALNLVKNILEEKTNLPDGVKLTPYVFTGTQISVHSPVNIDAYDSLGNHTGLTSDGNFIENIPGSLYETLDDTKLIFLPENGVYNIKFEAIDKGSFDFKIRKYREDIIFQEILYKDIPLTSLTKAEVKLNTVLNESPIIYLDENGDGTVDQAINPSSSLSGDLIYDQILPQTKMILDGIKGSNEWYRSNVKVTLLGQDDSSGSGILKTEYSLDDGKTINTYIAPFIISSEKVNKLKFRSIDNAGNEEDPQEAEIKIDKTAPEAKISIDQDKHKIVVDGVDMNSTTVARSNNKLTRKKDDAFYMISDLAGNTLKLDVREVDFFNLDKFSIYSVQRNNGQVKRLENNHFYAVYADRWGWFWKNKFNIKEQYFEMKNEVRMKILYDSKRNKSTIVVKEKGKEKVKEVKNGLVLLNLITDKANLITSY